MPTLLKGADVCADDPWILVQNSDMDPSALPDGALILPYRYWLDHRPAVDARGKSSAVWLDSDHEPDSVAEHLPSLPLIGIRFPGFNDGRALSLAVLLRTRFDYRGELRAIGDVSENLIHYMRRCGFNSFLIPDGRDAAVAQRFYNAMSDYYQASVVTPAPAFRRVARG